MKAVRRCLLLVAALCGASLLCADVLRPPTEPVEQTLTGKLVRVGDVSYATYQLQQTKGGTVELGETKALPAGVDAEKLVGKIVQVVAVTQTQPLKRNESVLIIKTIKSIKEIPVHTGK